MANDTLYKYRINEMLNKLPHNDYLKALRLFPVQLEVSQKTFSNYRNIKKDDTQDIPAEKVAIMEKLFDLEPGQLANYATDVKPIRDMPDSPDELAEQLGLSKN